MSRPITAARPLGGEPASSMRPDESDSGSEGSRGGFGGIDSPTANTGSDANVWKLEEDAADDAAREAYKLKLTTAREAWENEMDKEDAAARRRRELERDKEQLRLDQEEAKIRREMEEKFERLAIELKKAAKRREEEAEVEATALEKEAAERKAKAEETMREAAEKIADAKAKSAAAAALVADAEETRHAKEAMRVRFLDSEKKRLTEEEEAKIRAEMEPQIASLRAKLDAEREELNKQVAAAAEETSEAKSRESSSKSRVAALMSATEHLTDPKIEEMYATAAESSSLRRVEMAEARAQAAEDAARSRISLAEDAVVKAEREAMAAIEASRAQTQAAGATPSRWNSTGGTTPRAMTRRSRRAEGGGDGGADRTRASGRLPTATRPTGVSSRFEATTRRRSRGTTRTRTRRSRPPGARWPSRPFARLWRRATTTRCCSRGVVSQGPEAPGEVSKAGASTRQLGVARGGEGAHGPDDGRGPSRAARCDGPRHPRRPRRVDVRVHRGDTGDACAQRRDEVGGVSDGELGGGVLVDGHGGRRVGPERVRPEGGVREASPRAGRGSRRREGEVTRKPRGSKKTPRSETPPIGSTTGLRLDRPGNPRRRRRGLPIELGGIRSRRRRARRRSRRRFASSPVGPHRPGERTRSTACSGG